MPIYEYLCSDCGKQFEISQSMSDLPIQLCPSCKGAVRRIISGGSGFILKNAGGKAVQPRCGKTRTCCGSLIPCDTPHCEEGK